MYYPWEGQSFDDVAWLCARRDPRRYPLGCLTRAPGEAEGWVLQWFHRLPELSAFLWRMEPQRWGIRLGELAAFKLRIEPVIVRLDVAGISEELRLAHNALSLPRFEIAWWGDFAELCDGRGEWPRQILESFHGDGAPAPVADSEREAFVAFLREPSTG